MFEYNTSRNQLIIREYGRNIQKMIEDAVKIKDRKRRNEAAKAIIRLMSMSTSVGLTNTNNNLANQDPNKKLKESVDYWRKLWDHLIIISNYQLDVDSPFTKPKPKERLVEKMQVGNYRKSKIAFRSYGRYIEKIIKTVANYPDSERKVEITKDIANNMKKLYLIWNRDTVEDALILQQLSQLSNGRLTLPKGFELTSTQEIIEKNNINANKVKQCKSSKRKKKKHKSNNVDNNEHN